MTPALVLLWFIAGIVVAIDQTLTIRHKFIIILLWTFGIALLYQILTKGQ